MQLLRRNLLLLILLTSSGILFYGFTDFTASINSSSLVNDSDALALAKEQGELLRILKEAAMDDDTVILTTLNEAWAAPDSVIDLFLNSFKLGEGTDRLLNHLVIIALDQNAFSRCLVLHKHCFSLVTRGVDFHQEAFFRTEIYLKMTWRKIDFLRQVLEMGYSFVFTDVDIMWFRDPFPRFYSDADFQVASDKFSGNPEDIKNKANCGFNYVKSNNRSIEFYKYWYSSHKTYPGCHDQDVLDLIKFDPFVSEIGIEIRYLDTAFFSGLCENSKDMSLVCTFHANCCYGLDSKINDLRVMLQDWRGYLSLPLGLKNKSIVSWSVPQKCRRKSVLHKLN